MAEAKADCNSEMSIAIAAEAAVRGQVSSRDFACAKRPDRWAFPGSRKVLNRPID
jgi:hypothetical protein